MSPLRTGKLSYFIWFPIIGHFLSCCRVICWAIYDRVFSIHKMIALLMMFGYRLTWFQDKTVFTFKWCSFFKWFLLIFLSWSLSFLGAYFLIWRPLLLCIHNRSFPFGWCFLSGFFLNFSVFIRMTITWLEFSWFDRWVPINILL